MGFIDLLASLWNEFLIMGICFWVLSFALILLLTLLAGKTKKISSIVITIPVIFTIAMAKVSTYVAVILGMLQLALKLI